jgi:hypothetical protein
MAKTIQRKQSVFIYGGTTNLATGCIIDELSFPMGQIFDQSKCLEKSTGKPRSISMIELGAIPHKIEVELDA